MGLWYLMKQIYKLVFYFILFFIIEDYVKVGKKILFSRLKANFLKESLLYYY